MARASSPLAALAWRPTVVVTALLQLIPVFAGVAAGHLLVRTGAATREQGRFVFVFAFYVCAPALVFQAFAETELTRDLITLPLAAFLAVVGGYGAGVTVSRGISHRRGWRWSSWPAWS